MSREVVHISFSEHLHKNNARHIYYFLINLSNTYRHVIVKVSDTCHSTYDNKTEFIYSP